MSLEDQLKKIKILILDVDGVLTDGSIIINSEGVETKIFSVQDGAGLKMLRRAGIEPVIISGRKSPVTEIRAKELNIKRVYMGMTSKKKAFEEIRKEFRIESEEICVMGDDLVDLPLMLESGVAVAVPDAPEYVKAKANYVTKKRGGKGAVREVTDMLIKVQGKWDDLTERYFNLFEGK